MGKRTPGFLNLYMEKRIQIFKSFEEQERYFLDYFFLKNPSERLQALAELQKKNNSTFLHPSEKKIIIYKRYPDGYRTS
jgi:hypothetical protein